MNASFSQQSAWLRSTDCIRRAVNAVSHPRGMLCICLASLMLAGCGSSGELNTDYGRRRGSAGDSVNGLSVLSEMVRQAGGRPTTIATLSSNLSKYDVVIWAPDDFAPPREEVREFLERWLVESPGRTLVYVGRDYDAAWDYWNAMAVEAPADQRRDVLQSAAQARAGHSRSRVDMPSEEVCEWFVMRRDEPGRRVDMLGGPWSAGIDAPETGIWIQGQLGIPSRKELDKHWKNNPPAASWIPRYKLLLSSGRDPLVFQMTKDGWGTSRVIVVANGSFLLNLPLVQYPNRHLASELIEECQPFERVAFLESQSGGPLVHGDLGTIDEDAIRMRVLLAAHWFFLGAVFCFMVYPIFGRPKTLEAETVADFGQHVDALAALLERTGDVDYAMRQVELYRKGQPTDKDASPPNVTNVEPGGKDTQDARGQEAASP